MAANMPTPTTTPFEVANSLGQFVSASLIFSMQIGFLMLEVGSVRSTNAINIIFKVSTNIMDACIGIAIYFICGYALSFGSDDNGFIGTTGFFYIERSESYQFIATQMMFAMTAATIVSGGMAERTSISAYFLWSLLASGLVVPLVMHWTWSKEGWMKVHLHFVDHAGSVVVHVVGGVASLAGSILLGPRIGKFDSREIQIKGHNLALLSLGATLLWVGFLFFNAVSGQDFNNVNDIGVVLMNTIMAGPFGGIASALASRYNNKKWSIVQSLNGILGALVAICAPASSIEPWAAVIVGFVSGLVVFYSSMLLERLQIDDPLSAAPVHFGCGVWGVLSVGLFSTERSLFMTGSMKQFGFQLAATIIVIVWTLIWSYIPFWVLKYYNFLRVTEKTELSGLDFSYHGEYAYPEQVSHCENSDRNFIDINSQILELREDMLRERQLWSRILGKEFMDIKKDFYSNSHLMDGELFDDEDSTNIKLQQIKSSVTEERQVEDTYNMNELETRTNITQESDNNDLCDILGLPPDEH